VIEGTNTRFSWHPDSYYRNWPDKITEDEIEQGWYLKSLTHAEELAVFLQNRGYCLMDSGRFREAEVVFTRSHHLAPQDPLCPERIACARQAAESGRRRSIPGPIGGATFASGGPRLTADGELERINAFNRANMVKMMPPPPAKPAEPRGPFASRGPQVPGQIGKQIN